MPDNAGEQWRTSADACGPLQQVRATSAQGSSPTPVASGRRGRGFKSRHPDAGQRPIRLIANGPLSCPWSQTNSVSPPAAAPVGSGRCGRSEGVRGAYLLVDHRAADPGVPWPLLRAGRGAVRQVQQWRPCGGLSSAGFQGRCPSSRQVRYFRHRPRQRHEPVADGAATGPEAGKQWADAWG